MPQCCNVTLTSPGLYSFSSFIENDFTPEYASKAYSSMNFHICRQLCGTVRTEPIIPLGFLVPPLGQYLYSEVRKILGPSTTDPSHLGLSSLQMREPGWPAPGPALPALSTYLQPFLSAVRLAWEAVSVLCSPRRPAAAFPWCFMPQLLDAGLQHVFKTRVPLPAPQSHGCHVAGLCREHGGPRTLSHQARSWGARLLVPRGKEAGDRPQIKHISQNGAVEGRCCGRNLLSLACPVSRRGWGPPGDGLCVLGGVHPSTRGRRRCRG